MSYLRTRVKRVEDKLIGKKDGIPKWALEVAEQEAQRLRIDIITNPKDKPKPKPHINVEQFAKELADKFTSREDYERSLPPLDLSAVHKALNSIL